MNYIPIGSISVFINVANSQNQLINEKLLSDLESAFEADVKNELSKYQLDFDFYINAKSKRGCIIETISIGIILGAGYQFIKDYDKIRNNLKLISEDLKNVYIKITGKKNKKSNLFEAKKIEIIKDDSKIQSNVPLIIETETKKETITISTHKITILREDIKEKVSTSEIKKSKKK
ncbi:hypothetical protein [Aquimarina sp. RZ0]|uniref:hypothetical protein n=1 Tax=Aquimarina sp. RZ0 TaxID=2607730 RepID=UPI0011F39C89|nr:hypothetical protein [Aquimarina sp. RZ0]KAA1242873.1 hypothetical protein F0000_23545 [Aquimarina sp. RZ0]